jgi:basic membrane protein A
MTATVLALAVAAIPAGAAAEALEPAGGESVVFVIEPVGCSDAFQALLCDAFAKAVHRAGIDGRVVAPTIREDPEDVLELVVRGRHDLVVVFGFLYTYTDVLSRVAARHPEQQFAALDRSRADVGGNLPNVRGVVFRTSEAAYLAGWLTAQLERRRPGPDMLGAVGGFKIPAVDDFIVGYRAGARRAAPGAKVLVGYANDFLDSSKCEAIARRQIAAGAGAVFDVAGTCGLGALEAAADRGVWGIGVDTDQASLGPHILTSVIKRFDNAFANVFEELERGMLARRADLILTLRDGGVGLGKISPKVPRKLRAELEALRRRIVAGEIRVPGMVPTPS